MNMYAYTEAHIYSINNFSKSYVFFLKICIHFAQSIGLRSFKYHDESDHTDFRVVRPR